MAQVIEETVNYKILHPVNNPTGNPSSQGYKEIIHGRIGPSATPALSDAKDTSDTTVDPTKTYYSSTSKSASKASGSKSRGSDSMGYRGGGAADTEEASGNRSKLLEKALDYIKHHYKPDAFEVSVKAVDIHLLDPTVDTIEVGDVVKVILADGTEKRGTCLKIQYDLMAPENTEYTIGDPEKELV